jgi:cellulose synthase/poly-beta-1,6-N-acetylglucosamine synthase-like glycosyltransferase
MIMCDFKNISIIIPTTNEQTLEEVVRAAHEQMPGAEMIVVGYGPAGNVAVQYQARFLDMEKKTPKPAGINRAVRMAHNDWLIVLDADAIPQPGWGTSMLQGFREEKQLFSGSIDISHGPFWTRVYNLSYFHEVTPERGPQLMRYLPGLNLGFTRAAFNRIGELNESDVRSQDYDWTLRACRIGIALFLLPEARVIHEAGNRTSLKDVWNSWARNSFYNWRVRIRYQDFLGTPVILRFPLLILIFSPILAIWPTLRILYTSPKSFFKYIYLIPAVYLTKIAWCWGVFHAAWEMNHLGRD